VGNWCLYLLYPPEPTVPFIALGKAIWPKPVNEVFATGTEFIVWEDERELDLALQLAKK
jgi:hypothetical protein